MIHYDMSGKYLMCEKRGSRVPIASADRWLASERIDVFAMQVEVKVDGAQEQGQTQIGHQTAHESHQTRYDKDLELLCCTRCGSIA